MKGVMEILKNPRSMKFWGRKPPCLSTLGVWCLHVKISFKGLGITVGWIPVVAPVGSPRVSIGKGPKPDRFIEVPGAYGLRSSKGETNRWRQGSTRFRV